MDRSILRILREYWGYEAFRPLQEEIISSVLAGKDTLALLPTGGGKTITFQVPTMTKPGLCLVVTPLIALMKDQVDNLRQKNIRAAMIHSGMNSGEINVALENCIFGEYKFLYVSPERLRSDLFITRLKDMNVSLLAVDESHCISQWGYDFRPSYLQIADLRDILPDVPVLALTATATPQVVEDIQEKLHFKERNVLRTSFVRENISYVIRNSDDKLFEIIRILRNVPGCSIIYVRSRTKTKHISDELQAQGFSADFFHAGLPVDERIRKQNRWKSDQCRVMVSTNAFGMGIDKPDVRTVIHFGLPTSLEEYFQEAGRAGRDGLRSYAVALFGAHDAEGFSRRIETEFPDRDFILDVYEKLAYFFQIGMGMGLNTGHDFRILQFAAAYKLDARRVRSALQILDLSGYIQFMEEADKQSRFLFIVRRDELYRTEGLSGDLDRLVRYLLRNHAGVFTDYAYINEERIAHHTGLTHHQIYEGLRTLSMQSIIDYIPAQKVPTIYYTRHREELRRIHIPPSVYEERRQRFKERIEHVIDYGSSSGRCRSQILLDYFGETGAEACGRCDACLSNKKDRGKARFLADR